MFTVLGWWQTANMDSSHP